MRTEYWSSVNSDTALEYCLAASNGTPAGKPTAYLSSVASADKGLSVSPEVASTKEHV